ncbi:hypothetical protein HAP93_12145 [Acidithiobacillus ferriphilus]|uniref:hypothetical protein n=1 Tax=Acidithiobacillus ferriphilus TaxID=1689834 RepID=UPI001C060A58|nr:hypothetical protein [Acidithiobacillus ferriphilus]MBU2786495.1 hypothetical protein [Acidithiobacillus ferriphilus]MEB8474552.1 hypothetical protein [Acidithiobacillus ferriphilus]
MVKRVAGVPVRRVSAEFIGDDAVDLEIIEVSLGLNRISRSKSDRDTKLMQVALASLRNAIEQYRSKSGERYPEFVNFAVWLGIEADGKEESTVSELETLGVIHEQNA